MDFDNHHGDIHILVKNERSAVCDTLSVSSDAMRRASKVWSTLLSGPFAEGQGKTTTLDYTEDVTKAVVIVMDIVHLRFGRVPAILSLRELKDLAVFTDKFDLTEIVVPWMSRWLKWHGLNIDEMGNEIDWLWIAWEYGLVSVFNHVGNKLAFGGTLMAQGQPSGMSERHDMVGKAMLPPGTEDSILQARNDMTTTLLTLVYDYLDALLASSDRPQAVAGPFDNGSMCRSSRRDCLHLQLGSLVLALQSIGLYPKKTADEVNMLPSQLRDKLLKINLSDCSNNEIDKSNNGRFGGSMRKTCGDFERTKRIIEKSISDIASFATREVLRHVKEQNAKAKLSASLVPGQAGQMVLVL